MDSGFLDVLHDSADVDLVAVEEGVDVDLDGVFEEPVDEDRTVRGPDSPRLWAGRSARAQSSLGFRVLCYVCWLDLRN